MLTQDKPFVSLRAMNALAALVVVLGWLAAVGGVVYAINGATQAGGSITVSAQVHDLTGTTVRDSVPADATLRPTGSQSALQLGLPNSGTDSWMHTPADSWLLTTGDSSVAEQLLSRGDAVIWGLSALAAGYALRALILSISAGRPFAEGNARRIATMGVLAVAACWAGSASTGAAAVVVADRVGVTSQVNGVLSFSLLPLVVLPFVLVLAEAFRRGGELARDVDGLV
ncbi:DUF2975 domain-containing protein [Luteipulveratus mongoliensis]|uniref:DUF2975 domain-containing protein n=1 Tax=Luteipulveratus mongoliensis TaxID=571913 RepID=A0A0K1JJ73_9MICO|nr:DUF2975 domain-containing protein [Luteipulveratus mongoliensis]AKU16746.1 hypothetical protein VV02_14175 [Luteipulveratus mongoliensis]